MSKNIIERIAHTDRPLLYVGVNNALGAYIAQQCGADGVWLSSFELSASHRLPDADILTTNEYAQVIDSISDRIKIPLLVDADEGHGNAINVIRVVREYEKNGANGIVIEDNIYPKQCSFYEGKRPLEDPNIFAGKIKAAKDHASSKFFVGARTEALIANHGIDEALERATIYESAGADAIIIHSKKPIVDEIQLFAKKWKEGSNLPIICIPTTYNQTKYNDLYDMGFRLQILANYGIRATVKVLEEVYSRILSGKSLSSGNDLVCSMNEIFDLVFVDTLKENEERYIGKYQH